MNITMIIQNNDQLENLIANLFYSLIDYFFNGRKYGIAMSRYFHR